MEFKQIYKTRAEAFRLFVAAQNLPRSQSQFYQDADRRKMVRPDKTVHLSDLLAYVQGELQGEAATGRSVADEELSRHKARLEVRKLEAEVEAKEKANRKEDDRWMEVAEHDIQMAAFAGLIEDTLRQFTTLRLMELIYLCGGDSRKAAEFNRGLEDLYAGVFTDAVREQTRSIEFEGEGDDDFGD